MKSIDNFLNNKLSFNNQCQIIGGGRGADTWEECHEDTYSGCGDEYVQVTDDDGKHILSYELEDECPR